MRFKKEFKNIYLLIPILIVGCVTPQEGVRRFAGRSVAHFEKYRDNAISQDISCQASECFNVILAIGGNRSEQPRLEKHFEVFQANKRQGFIVFYGIPGQVDTTEVAVFIVPEGSQSRVQVVSLSSAAQEKVAKVVFEELKKNF